MAFCRLSMLHAQYIISAIFANSDGWNQVLAADNEPALEIAVAVKNKHENKKEKRDGYREKRQVFEYPVIYSRHQEHQHNAGYGKDQLTFYIIIRIAIMSVYGVDYSSPRTGLSVR